MKRANLVWSAISALKWALCVICILDLVSGGPLAPLSSSKHDSSTLVVTNDGTYRNTSAPDNGRATNRNGAEKRRQGKQSRGGGVDLSQWFKEDTKAYPDDEINRLLRKTPEFVKDLFNVLNTQLDPHMNLTERVAFYNDDDRQDEGAVREESVCRTVTRNIYPREATRQNSLVYIPNNQEFMQVIQAEICQHPDRECSYLRDSLPYGMTSVCYQKYAYKKLLYLDSVDKRMASDLFRYPSCCACFIRSLPFDLRSATNATTPAATLSSLSSQNDAPNSGAPQQNDSVPDESSTLASSTSRSLDSQQSQTTRGRKQTRPANQTVILNANKVFEANK